MRFLHANRKSIFTIRSQREFVLKTALRPCPNTVSRIASGNDWDQEDLLCNKKSRNWGTTWEQVAVVAALQRKQKKKVGNSKAPSGTFSSSVEKWHKKSGILARASERRPARLRSRSPCTRFCFHEAARVAAERGVCPPPASRQERVVHGH